MKKYSRKDLIDLKSVAFCTLGCKVNQYETEAMRELFFEKGYREADFDDFADVYVINTCTVTAMSDRKSRQMIRRAKRINPDSFVIVCGCYAQVSPDTVSSIDGVDLVLGTKERGNIAKLADDRIKSCLVSDISRTHNFEGLTVNNHQNKSRAYVKIQEGCNQFCSYCIIPYARGPIRSRPVNEIIEESNKLAKAGFTEIIYVGIHVASYGLDTKETDLGGLLVMLNNIEGIKRIRLSSIEPMTLNEAFLEKIKDCDKLCPHFHLSLQSGCDETLKRMNRRYTTEEYYKIVEGLRKHFTDCAITTDIMVGFPGETDEEFEKTLEFTKKVAFSEAHIFKYSRRKGTPADKMPDQIPPEVKDIRSKKLFEVCEKSHNDFLNSHLGKPLEVLFEVCDKGMYEGKTQDYITVYAKYDSDITSTYRMVIGESVKDGCIFGKIID